MKKSNNNILYNQLTGFLNMPNLLLNTNALAVESLDTLDHKTIDVNNVDLNALHKQKYLGKRAEYFMKVYLEQHKNVKDVYHSLQVQGENNTLGELDFLFFDVEQNEWIHLELICKFYVFTGNENQNDIASWIGPNLKDRLDYKIHKLRSHQLKILERPETQKVLNEKNVDLKNIKTKICYKAKLYLPFDSSTFIPNQLNSDCLKGNCYNYEIFKDFQFSEMLFYVPHKHEWLCQPKTNNQWYDFDKAKNILKQSIDEKRSKMVWRKTKTGNYYEDFVVWW